VDRQSGSWRAGHVGRRVVVLAVGGWLIFACGLLADPVGTVAANRPVRGDLDAAVPDAQGLQVAAPDRAAGKQAGQAEESQPIRRPERSGGLLERAGVARRAVEAGPRMPWYRSGFVALTAVLLLIVALTLVVKRLMPGVRRLQGGVLEVVSRTYLSPKQSVALVKMGHQLVLIGITPEQISSLAVVDDPDRAAELIGLIEASKPTSISGGFGRWLSGQTERMHQVEHLEAPLEATPLASYMQAKGQLRGALDKVRARMARVRA